MEETNLSIYRNIYEITLYKFLLATGCRINEALALHWSDIDLHNATVNITKTLNHLGEINSPKSEASYRTIDIDPQTIEVLKVYQGKKLGNLVGPKLLSSQILFINTQAIKHYQLV